MEKKNTKRARAMGGAIVIAYLTMNIFVCSFLPSPLHQGLSMLRPFYPSTFNIFVFPRHGDVRFRLIPGLD